MTECCVMSNARSTPAAAIRGPPAPKNCGASAVRSGWNVVDWFRLGFQHLRPQRSHQFRREQVAARLAGDEHEVLWASPSYFNAETQGTNKRRK